MTRWKWDKDMNTIEDSLFLQTDSISTANETAEFWWKEAIARKATIKDLEEREKALQDRIEWLIAQNDVESADAAKARAERDAALARLDERESAQSARWALYRVFVYSQ